MDITVSEIVLASLAILGGISGWYYLREKGFAIKLIITIVTIGIIVFLFFRNVTIKFLPDNNSGTGVEQTQISPNENVGTTVGIESNPNIPTQTPAPIQPVIVKEPVKKQRMEATGESGYKLTEKWALEEAEKDAYNKLKRRLNKPSLAYDIDNKKTSVIQTEHDGWKATVVIFTYE